MTREQKLALVMVLGFVGCFLAGWLLADLTRPLLP